MGSPAALLHRPAPGLAQYPDPRLADLLVDITGEGKACTPENIPPAEEGGGPFARGER